MKSKQIFFPKYINLFNILVQSHICILNDYSMYA